MIPRILIRHLTGSKAHRVDQFPLADVEELTVGRTTASHVSFDGQHDTTVSRRHAVIKVMRRDRLSFKIADLGSSNGVRINGMPIRMEQDLRADDLVELGPGGPAFKLGVEPAFLRHPDAADDDPTVATAFVIPSPPASHAAAAATLADRAVHTRPKAARRVSPALGLWGLVALLAGAGVIFDRGVIGRGCSWVGNEVRLSLSGIDRMQHRSEPMTAANPILTTPPARLPTDAVVYIEARWRLYDKTTGRPVYQKILVRRAQRLPCFVETDDGRIVPWLTTDDDDHANSPIGGVIRGSGFIVSSQGGIITNRHIAAGWTAHYFDAPSPGQLAAVFHIRTLPGFNSSFRLLDLKSLANTSHLGEWIPADGGTLFRSRYPAAFGTIGKNLEGRNDSLDVLLPSSHANTPARLILMSTKADVAELRIDTGGVLPVVSISHAGSALPGEPVTALGYQDSLVTALDQQSTPFGATPHVSSSKGTIVAVSRPAQTLQLVASSDDPAADAPADVYQVSMSAASVADGGPLLGPDGAALGVMTSDPAGGVRHVFAYSVGAARALLDSQ